MQRGLEFDWKVDERALDHPHISTHLWQKLDAMKAKSGWLVIESPTIGMLKSMLSENLFAAVEADECPVRFQFDGRQMNFPGGVTEKEVRRIVAMSEKAAKQG